jgi:hypothetical protein
MGLALLLVPLMFAAIAAAVPSNRLRPLLLPIGSGVQLLLVLRTLSLSQLSDWEHDLGLGSIRWRSCFCQSSAGCTFCACCMHRVIYTIASSGRTASFVRAC